MSKCIFKIEYRDKESVYLRGMGCCGLLLSSNVLCSGSSNNTNPDFIMAGIYCRRLKKNDYL